MNFRKEKYCPLFKCECVKECMFKDDDNCCTINEAAKALIMLTAHSEDEGINVNVSFD